MATADGTDIFEIMSKKDVLDIFNNLATPENISNITSQLAENAKHLTQYDIFSDSVNKVLDGTKLTNILNTNDKTTFFLPDGNYSLNSPITISNEVSLIMGQNATIQATSSMTDMITYSTSTVPTVKRMIKGGVLDGNGLAQNCIHVTASENLTLEGLMIKDPINRGIKADGGYELMIRNVLLRNTISTNTTDNIGIEINTSDSITDGVVIVNFNTGIHNTQAENYFSNVHIWVNQSNRAPLTTGILNNAMGAMFDNIYFDTMAVGIETDHVCALSKCIFNFGDSFRQYLTSNPIYIKNEASVYIAVDKCSFEYTNTGTNTNSATVVSGTMDLVNFINCNFATPSTLTSAPTYITNTVKIFKVRADFTFSSAISAGATTNVTKAVSQTGFSIDYRDTVILDLGVMDTGLIGQPYIQNGTIGLKITNVSTGAITPTTKTIFATIIKNFDNTYLPYVTQT